MDPLILLAVAALVIFVLLKVFFGIAKLFFRIGLILLIAFLLWRFLVMKS